MPDQILTDVYYLKSHPFPNIYRAPLNPRVDPAHANYYFDLYDWTRSSTVRKVSPQDPQYAFPDAGMLATPESILVLIAGSNQTGRESLRNLILHKFEQATLPANRPPILTEIELEEGNRADIIRQIASTFMWCYPANGMAAPTLDALQQVFANVTAGPAQGDQSYYSTLFNIWKMMIRAQGCTRPMVLSVSGLHKYNTLQVVFNSTRQLFKFIIATTDRPTDAETCRKLLADEKRIVELVGANRLDRAKAADYVRWRMREEREPDSPCDDESLVPFCAEALDELYAEGPNLKAGETISWEVEFLNKTLRCALDEHYAELKEKMNGPGPAVLNTLSAAERLIGPEHIRKARNAINNNVTR